MSTSLLLRVIEVTLVKVDQLDLQETLGKKDNWVFEDGGEGEGRRGPWVQSQPVCHVQSQTRQKRETTVRLYLPSRAVSTAPQKSPHTDTHLYSASCILLKKTTTLLVITFLGVLELCSLVP